LKSQEAAWEEKHALMFALEYALPEMPLTPAARKQLQKRADEVARSTAIKSLKGEELNFEMQCLARDWLEKQARGRGRRLKGLIQKFLVQEAVRNKYQKHLTPNPKIQRALDEISKLTGLRITHAPKRPMHKQILGTVGDRLGIGVERMKQL